MSEKFERKPQIGTPDERIKNEIDHLRESAEEKAEIAKILREAILESIHLNGKPNTMTVPIYEAIAEVIAGDTDTLDQIDLVEAAVKAVVGVIERLHLSNNETEDVNNKREIIRDFKAIVQEKLHIKTPGGASVKMYDPYDHK